MKSKTLFLLVYLISNHFKKLKRWSKWPLCLCLTLAFCVEIQKNTFNIKINNFLGHKLIWGTTKKTIFSRFRSMFSCLVLEFSFQLPRLLWEFLLLGARIFVHSATIVQMFLPGKNYFILWTCTLYSLYPPPPKHTHKRSSRPTYWGPSSRRPP